MLVDTNRRDTATSIFGKKVTAPIRFSPNTIYHPQGEIPVAKVAKELNLPYALIPAGSTGIKDVAEANADRMRISQLYMLHHEELALSLPKRAVDSDYNACFLTLDTLQLGWQHEDVATSNYAFSRGIGADLRFSDPVF
jgi:isopentenyl diphosphate isomerase/L-lactate dehydrogenase-like FMN-dependent dehydrogenase